MKAVASQTDTSWVQVRAPNQECHFTLYPVCGKNGKI